MLPGLAKCDPSGVMLSSSVFHPLAACFEFDAAASGRRPEATDGASKFIITGNGHTGER